MVKNEFKKRFEKIAKSESLKFFLKFVAYVIPLFALWIFIGKFYVESLMFLTKIFFSFSNYAISSSGLTYYVVHAGLRLRMEMAKAVLVDFNIVPFFALIFATKAEWKKKLIYTGMGFLAILFIHALTMTFYIHYLFNVSEPLYYFYSLSTIINPALPFIIWFLLFYQGKKK